MAQDSTSSASLQRWGTSRLASRKPSHNQNETNQFNTIYWVSLVAIHLLITKKHPIWYKNSDKMMTSGSRCELWSTTSIEFIVSLRPSTCVSLTFFFLFSNCLAFEDFKEPCSNSGLSDIRDLMTLQIRCYLEFYVYMRNHDLCMGIQVWQQFLESTI